MSEPTEYLPGAEEAEPEPETQTEALAVIAPPVSPLAARDAGIAAYLASAYGKAGTLRLTPEETKALKADFPDEDFVTGAAGKENLIYLDPRRLRDRLDDALGMGAWSLVPIRTWNEDYKVSTGPAVRVYRECVLIVRGVFITQSTGDMSYFPNNPATNYGDAYQGAESHSLRRCLKNFGVGLQAYSKVFQAGWFERKQAALRGQNAPGRAATSPPPSTATPPPAAAPTPKPATPPPAKTKKPLEMATANTRARVLELLGAQDEGPVRNHLHGYLVSLGWLENEKVVEQWPYRFVPLTPEELEALKVGLGSFSQNGVAVRPYQPHGMDPAELNATPVKEVTKPAAPPPLEPELPPVPTKAGWRDHVITFGRSLMGKSLGSLPEDHLKHYIDNFTVVEATEDAKGVKQDYAPSIVEAQKALRAALDQAAAELAQKPTTKG